MINKNIKTINDRVKEVRKIHKLTQKEFAERIGLSQNHLSYIERGKRNVFQNIINAIFLEFGIDRDWLITGEGYMYDNTNHSVDSEQSNEINEIVDMLFTLNEQDREFLVMMINNLYERAKQQNEKE
ncbi:TPA: helix-turn-helix transcriptional regulator [Clostridioides difficile]|uniref:helix-turn-helix domain-containing protein n=1 Tax=Clostridioides difficile TaxID=1496 RepID=UPI0010AF54C6|nr:helix-turn-helix transcriptional regulator [Clostridioides difficile]MBH7263621.1 helix-turn-helix transcriptional regulator [Clostridioides difficile]MCO5894513.1 helix-turn-helix transcriptional regulator [Clostridioides difficile]MDM9849118.1 helix-turn-helix transcriptional regulator [Clostridioides difficile]MDN9069313.1 helix-turn-helix transcriptional regulator [Clostridioides difficile]VII72039.1 putative prophage repressor [Clostridioides difficile]